MSYRRYILNLSSEKELHDTARLLNASSARYGGDWHSVPHTHSYAELFYTVGGRGQFRIEDKLYPVMPNHLVLISPNVVHTEVSYNANPLEYIVLGIEGLELSGDSGNGRFCILDCPDGGEILHCLRNILREMESQQPGYEEVCQAFMEILIIRLARSTNLTTPAAASTGSRQCTAVRRYIDTHFKEPLNLELLAREAHLNKYYLSHVFKREYGVSPISYMISCRIAESKYLLAETDLSLSQISQLLGFSSASYFSQSFRRSENMSPLDYRRNNSAEGKSAPPGSASRS